MNFDLDTEDGMANAIAWTDNLFSTIKEGGTWFVPRSSTWMKVSHARKEVTITDQWIPDPSINRVVQAMGWTIKEQA